MGVEVNRSINWLLVLADVLKSSLISIITMFFGDFENILDAWLLAIAIASLVTFWRFQSHKIIIDDQVYFKRLLFPDHVIAFEDVITIDIYDDKRSRPFSLKRSFLEVDTKKKYFTYYLDHFDVEEVFEVLKYGALRSKDENSFIIRKT